MITVVEVKQNPTANSDFVQYSGEGHRRHFAGALLQTSELSERGFREKLISFLE